MLSPRDLRQQNRGFRMATNPPPDFSADSKAIFESLLNFDVMIGGKLIRIIYYIGLVMIGLSALAGVLSALSLMSISFAYGLGMLIGLVIGVVIGVLIWRLMCELWVLMFRIHDELVAIRRKP